METSTVKEIHQAVDAASDVLLMDVPYNYDKIKSRNLLGFKSEEMVVDEKDWSAAHNLAKEYQAKYPLFKFITEHQMAKIRAKYGLVRGDISDFKGAIPEKNIAEMQNFRINGEDLAEARKSSNRFEDMLMDAIKETFPGAKAEMHKMSFGIGRMPTKETFHTMMEDNIGRQLFKNMNFADVNRLVPGAITITADKSLFNVAIPHICPIVTVGVKGGYLIVSAWGDEASDPDVINPTMN